MIERTVWVVAGVVVSSCIHTAPYRMASRRVPEGVTQNDVYVGAVRLFSRAGLEIREKDESAGIVATEWEQADKVIIDSGIFVVMLHAWRVIVTEDGFDLAIDCRINDSGRLTLCTKPERHPTWVQAQARLADMLVAFAIKAHERRQPREPEPEEPWFTCDEGKPCGNTCIDVDAECETE